MSAKCKCNVNQGRRFAFDIGGDITTPAPNIFDRPLTTVSCHLKSLFIAYGSQHIHDSFTEFLMFNRQLHNFDFVNQQHQHQSTGCLYHASLYFNIDRTRPRMILKNSAVAVVMELSCTFD